MVATLITQGSPGIQILFWKGFSTPGDVTNVTNIRNLLTITAIQHGDMFDKTVRDRHRIQLVELAVAAYLITALF